VEATAGWRFCFMLDVPVQPRLTTSVELNRFAVDAGGLGLAFWGGQERARRG